MLNKTALTVKKIIDVRFSEVDSMGVVWHGNFIKYFEDGREAFGHEYGIGYMQIHRLGYFAPLINVSCDYKSYVSYEDKVSIETTFVDSPAAKIIFSYKVLNLTKGELAATGSSTQVLVNHNKELILTIPEFFMNWKKKHKLIS